METDKTNIVPIDALTPQEPFKIEETPVAPMTPINQVDSILRGIETEQTEAQKLDEQLRSNIFSVLPQLEGQAQTLAEEQTKAGLPELKKELQAYNSRILQLQAETQQDDIQLANQLRQEERRDTLLPFAQMGQAKIAGDAQIVRALKNAEIGVLNARALAKQGEMALAMETAQNAVDVKYAPYREQLSRYENLLKVIEPMVSREEKKQMFVQEQKLNRAYKELEKAEEEEKTINKMIIDATPNAPVNVISNAKTIADKGGSAMDVAIALGEYGGEFLQTQLLKEQIETQKAQRSKIWADINAIKAEQQATTGVTYDPEATKKSISQLQFLKDQANKAISLAGKAGNTGIISKAYRFVAGATDYTRLEAVSNTLRTNVLTLMTDPEIKKFFGPQMSEADVRLMTAGGTTLNPELQNPADLKEEVNRLLDLFARMEDSIKQNSPEYQYINQLTENIDVTGTALTPTPSAYINSFNLEN